LACSLEINEDSSHMSVRFFNFNNTGRLHSVS
jgi:hypothetical protein